MDVGSLGLWMFGEVWMSGCFDVWMLGCWDVLILGLDRLSHARPLDGSADNENDDDNDNNVNNNHRLIQ